MSFPNFPEKHTLESLLKAEDIVAYRRVLGRLPKFRKLDGVLFCLERGLPRRMRWRIPVRRAGSMNADVYEVKKNGAVVLTSFGGGSPIVVELAEEMAVLGARRMALMTAGGILQPGMKAGDVVVCTRAVRDDGASHHYLPQAKYIEGDEQFAAELAEAIRARGVPCSMGATWTTDAPYRETLEEVRRYRAEGVKTVEMESAGLFTVGQVRGLATASVVIALDNLAEDQWRPPQRLEPVLRSLEIVYAACVEVLGGAR